jgi:CRP-like cAMP-binding protein
LGELAIERTFPPGAVLMFQEEPGERVMILLEGRVKISTLARDGRETMLDIRDPGEVLGELAVIDGQPRLATVTALDPVRAWVLSSAAFRRYLETTPQVAVTLLEAVSRRVREATVMRLQFGTLDTLGRLCARLVELADRYGESVDGGIAFTSPVSQEELARWTGASRAGIAHALHELRQLNWIETHGREIVVKDRDALRARLG